MGEAARLIGPFSFLSSGRGIVIPDLNAAVIINIKLSSPRRPLPKKCSFMNCDKIDFNAP